MASGLRECRCGRMIPTDWCGDCVECQQEYDLGTYTGRNQIEREHRRLNALMNRGLEYPGLDMSDPVVMKIAESVARQDECELILAKRQAHRQLAGQAALERLRWKPEEADS